MVFEKHARHKSFPFAREAKIDYVSLRQMSKRQIQIKLDREMFRERAEFGGSLMRKAKYRTARPISSKDKMHMVLKSTKAVGPFSFSYKANPIKIKQILDRHCAKYAVKLVSYSNNSNHLHMHLKFPSRQIYLKFVRSLTATIAMAVTGACKRKSLKSIVGAGATTAKFWDFRPFTRVIRGLRGFKILQDYIRLNQLEAARIVPKRDGRLRDVEEHERRYFA